MTVHSTVLQLARRLRLFLPLAGVGAVTAHLLALSPGVCPGVTAALTAAAAGLTPPSGISHPLFALVARRVASLELFSLPIRLNLLSALCGACCAMLLYLLTARLILFSACEDEGGGGRNLLMDTPAGGGQMQPEVALHNRRVFGTAVVGGLAAAFLLTFSAPSWIAATRLHFGLFDLLLALLSVLLFPAVGASKRPVGLFLSFFLFTLGVSESAVFLVLLPVYGFFLFNVFVASRRRLALIAGLGLAGVLGVAVSLYAFSQNTDASVSTSLTNLLRAFVFGLPFNHYRELGSLLPRAGWVLVLLQVGLPALVLLFGKQILFKERGINTLLALLLVLLSAAPGMLNLSVSPFSLHQATGHLSVFGAALAATAAAAALSACLVFFIPADESQATSVSSRKKWVRSFVPGFVVVFIGFFTVLTLATPWRSFRATDSRPAMFADGVAREMLSAMDGRTWLVSSGFLDDHLRIQALMTRLPLVLVSLQGRSQLSDRARLSRLIEASDMFEGLNRQRLQNALAIGHLHFVMEWFKMDANAGSRAMVFATPDIWAECGYRPVPEGLAFGGVPNGQKLELAGIEKKNRAFSDRVWPLLSKRGDGIPQLDALRELLAMRAGFVYNELGVMLEDGGDYEAAFGAYQRASQIDPMNISAWVNAYSLTCSRNIHAEAQDKLKKRMTVALSNRQTPVRGLMGVLQNYGTIRDPAFYQQQAALWSAIGTRKIATDRLRRAVELSGQSGASALVQKALVHTYAGDLKKAEECYRAALAEDGVSEAAYSGLSTLLLTQHKTSAAELAMQEALKAGVDKEKFLFQTVTLAIFKKNTEQALKLLKGATEKYPDDLRYWTLLADILLNQGDLDEVEHVVLPAMKTRLKSADHFLVSAIQGLVLRKKGPRFFKEARLSLLEALSMNAALTDIWKALFELDMAMGKLDYLEVDARSMLSVDSGHAQANYLMGVCLIARGRLREAEDFLRRSIESEPTAAAHNDLAECLRQQQRLADAEASAKRALELEPELLAAQDTLACVLCDGGRYAEAEALTAKVVSAQPDYMPFQLTSLRVDIAHRRKIEAERRLKVLDKAKFAVPESLRREFDALP